MINAKCVGVVLLQHPHYHCGSIRNERVLMHYAIHISKYICTWPLCWPFLDDQQLLAISHLVWLPATNSKIISDNKFYISRYFLTAPCLNKYWRKTSNTLLMLLMTSGDQNSMNSWISAGWYSYEFHIINFLDIQNQQTNLVK